MCKKNYTVQLTRLVATAILAIGISGAASTAYGIGCGVWGCDLGNCYSMAEGDCGEGNCSGDGYLCWICACKSRLDGNTPCYCGFY